MPAAPLAIGLAVVAGLAGGIQIVLNGIFGRRIGVIEASAFATIVTMVSMNAFALATTRSFSGLSAGLRAPPWLWLGGLMSATLILSLTFAAPRIGILPTVGIMIAGQLTVGLTVDALGLGVDRVPLSLNRVAGILLLAAGSWLALRR